MPEYDTNTLGYEGNIPEDNQNIPVGLENLTNFSEEDNQSIQGANLNTKEDIQSIKNLEEDEKNISGGYKKTSVAIPLELVALIDAQPMKQSQTVVEALKFYFSDAKQKLEEYPRIISEYERKQIESDKIIAVLQAQVGTFDFLKEEFTRLHTLLDEQKEMSKAHMAQVQSMLEERKRQDYILQQKEEKILQLEENNQKAKEKPAKKRKWEFWKKE